MCIAFGLGLRGCTSCADCKIGSTTGCCSEHIQSTRLSHSRTVEICAKHTCPDYALIVRIIHNRFVACQRECWYLCCSSCESGRLGMAEYAETHEDTIRASTQTHTCWRHEPKNVHFANSKMAAEAFKYFKYMFKHSRGTAITCCNGKGMQAIFL